jgi:hypothetical protein
MQYQGGVALPRASALPHCGVCRTDPRDLGNGTATMVCEGMTNGQVVLVTTEPLDIVDDQMTHGGQKGFGMTKHDQAWPIGARDPIARFRFLQRLEAQKNDRKDQSRIKDPKQSVEELFHPSKPTRT